MQVRKVLASALVGGMVLVVPVSTAFASTSAPKGGDHDGLLGGLLGGDEGGSLLGNGCREDELISVGGDAGLIGVNLSGDLDTDHGLLGIGDKEDELLSVGGDQGIVGVNDDLRLDTDGGLVGLALGCEHKN